MKFLAIEKEITGVNGKQYQPYLKDEALKVWKLQQAGFIREIYFANEGHNAVIILECSDIDEANSVLNSLPLVREKLIEFEIKQLVPYDGFERLFDKVK